MANTKQTIDLTPSWVQSAKVILIGLQHGNEDGKKIAQEELLHMGRIADKYASLVNSDKTQINAFYEVKAEDITSDLMSRLKSRAVFLNHDLGFMTNVLEMPAIIAGLLRYKDKQFAQQAEAIYVKAQELTFIYVRY